MSYTQSLCNTCWNAFSFGLDPESGQKPTRIKDPEMECCCNCGVWHDSGIYVRINPKIVTFHRPE